MFLNEGFPKEGGSDVWEKFPNNPVKKVEGIPYSGLRFSRNNKAEGRGIHVGLKHNVMEKRYDVTTDTD